MAKAKVYLIGAGPGDPELLTLKGQKLLQKADVVIYDYLVNKKMLSFVKKGAQKIAASELRTEGQKNINVLMIQNALAGKNVVRLKSGDPYLFGMGREESEALVSAGIDYEVVPGITAAMAAADLLFIPLTDRRLASSVTFVTGHEARGKKHSRKGTLVFYMGVKNLPKIVERLIENGRDKKMPVAIIEKVSLPAQRIVEGNLGNIVARAKKRKVSPPAIIIVGEVAALRKKLCEEKP